MQTTSHKQSHRTPDGVQTKSESLHEDQMVESVPQVKFEKECGFLAIMDTDPQVKFEIKLFFISITKPARTRTFCNVQVVCSTHV